MADVVPTARQLEYQDWQWGLFLHFGIRTFYEGHRDWDGKAMPAEGFGPTQFDAGDWARAAADAGMKYMVLTAKHHDGFANWPTAFSDYSVAHTPWKGGRGDVVAEYVAAARAAHLAVGLYYSPAEASDRFRSGRARDYDEHFLAQIGELVGGRYGAIDILWFDGCGSEGHQYDWPRIIAEVRRMQPEVLIFNMGEPDFRWIGNEQGIAPCPTWNVVDEVPFSVLTEEGRKPAGAGSKWLPAECDCRMRDRNWFYSDADEHTVKSVEELMGLYYLSVGRGCNLLINIGPDRRGLLPDKDAARLREFGAEVRRRFCAPEIALENFPCPGGRLEVELDEPTLIDHAVIEEDLTGGEHIRRFSLSAHAGQPITLHEGHNVGHKAICRFPAVRTRRLLFTCDADCDPVRLRRLALYNCENRDSRLQIHG